MELIDKDKVISILSSKITDIKLDMKCGFLEKRKGNEKILVLKHIISLINTLKEEPFNYRNVTIKQKDFASCIQEGDKIRKRILLSLEKDLMATKNSGCNTKDLEECIVWLENQGEQEEPQVYETEDGEVITYSETDGYKIIGPKFKVDDFIKHNKANIICKVIAVNSNGNSYYVENIRISGSRIELFNAEQNFHLWTIQDAKDGDVLVASDGSIFLFKGTINCVCKHYVALTTDGVIEFNEGLKHYWETSKAAHPATKEQRDLLFQKMKEAGYEWDADKKELKKVEQKPAWSVDDENRFNNLFWLVEHSNEGKATKEGFIKFINSLKTLKGRVQPQWKPSEEQMAHLVAAIEESDGNCILQSLYNDLKKL